MLLKVESPQLQKQLFIEMTGDDSAGKVLPMVENARYAEFASRLKDSMLEKKLTITDIKSALKVSYEMARRYTLGIAMPRDDKMRRLGDVVGKTAAYLQFGDADQINSESNLTDEEDDTWPVRKFVHYDIDRSEKSTDALIKEIREREIPDHIYKSVLTLLQTCPVKSGEKKSLPKKSDKNLTLEELEHAAYTEMIRMRDHGTPEERKILSNLIFAIENPGATVGLSDEVFVIDDTSDQDSNPDSGDKVANGN